MTTERTFLAVEIENQTDAPMQIEIDWMSKLGQPVGRHFSATIAAGASETAKARLEIEPELQQLQSFIGIGEGNSLLQISQWPVSKITVKGTAGNYTVSEA